MRSKSTPTRAGSARGMWRVRDAACSAGSSRYASSGEEQESIWLRRRVLHVRWMTAPPRTNASDRPDARPRGPSSSGAPRAGIGRETPDDQEYPVPRDRPVHRPGSWGSVRTRSLPGVVVPLGGGPRWNTHRGVSHRGIGRWRRTMHPRMVRNEGRLAGSRIWGDTSGLEHAGCLSPIHDRPTGTTTDVWVRTRTGRPPRLPLQLLSARQLSRIT